MALRRSSAHSSSVSGCTSRVPSMVLMVATASHNASAWVSMGSSIRSRMLATGFIPAGSDAVASGAEPAVDASGAPDRSQPPMMSAAAARAGTRNCRCGNDRFTGLLPPDIPELTRLLATQDAQQLFQFGAHLAHDLLALAD